MPRPFTLLMLPVLALVLLAGTVGGQHFAPDADLVRGLGEYRQASPALTMWMIWLTQLGGAAVLVPVAAGTAGALWWRERTRAAVWLLATVLGGRTLVELMKWATDRPRPAFGDHPVAVASQAFPSGHAANSMITYLAIALFALPPQLRTVGAVIAMAVSLAVGATRPFLGVHWPSDVVAGWLFGAAWAMLLWRWMQARRPITDA